MRVDDARDRDPAARELLDDHRVGRQVEPHPAVLLGDRHPEQPELLHLLDDRLRELVRGVVVLGLRDDLLVDELADHLDDRLLLVGLLVERGGDGHRASIPVRRRAHRCDAVRCAPMNFARDVVEAAPPEQRALVELGRDGAGASGRFGRARAAGARTLAAHLDARGVRRGDVVLTLVGNRPEWVITMVACFRQGYVVLPCTEQLRAEGPAAAARGRRSRGSSSPTSATPPCSRPPAGAGRRSGRRGASGRRATRPPPARARARGSVPDHVHVRHRGRAEGGAARPALPRRPATAGRALARRATGRPRLVHGRGGLVEVGPQRVHRARGCGAPPRCCTTPASTRTSGWSCSRASASPCCAWRRRSTA